MGPTSVPSSTEIAGERNPTRKDILGAMQRILAGYPRHVPPGAASVVNLATEARIGRHHLYQAHSDLRERFEYLRDKAQQMTEKEAELSETLNRTKLEFAKLQALQSTTLKSARDWKALSQLLARAINTLQEELHKEQTKTRRLEKRLGKLEAMVAPPSSVIPMQRRTPHDS
jgi:predicted RNase H-like nuclease (RuvC/YqgF family)